MLLVFGITTISITYSSVPVMSMTRRFKQFATGLSQIDSNGLGQVTRNTPLNTCEPTLNSDWLNTSKLNLAEDIDIERLIDMATNYQSVQPGGIWSPESCTPAAKVAVIITYRNRESHLKVILKVLHTLLQNQQLHYGIYVVEMAMPTKFNIGILMNVGFLKAKSEENYDCYIFHDVDLVPLNGALMYTCRQFPNHMSAFNTKYLKGETKKALPYSAYVGGIISLKGEHYEQINGFSNAYFGWGGTDDDIEIRAKRNKLKFVREKPEVGRYYALPHVLDGGNDQNKIKGILLKRVAARMSYDGLNNAENLTKVEKFERRPLYSWLLVKCNETDVMDSNVIETSYYPTISGKLWIVKQPTMIRCNEKYVMDTSNHSAISGKLGIVKCPIMIRLVLTSYLRKYAAFVLRKYEVHIIPPENQHYHTMQLTAAVLVTLVATATAHLCMLSPRQRGTMDGINKAGTKRRLLPYHGTMRRETGRGGRDPLATAISVNREKKQVPLMSLFKRSRNCSVCPVSSWRETDKDSTRKRYNESPTVFSDGTDYQLSFQKNADHCDKNTPGYFNVTMMHGHMVQHLAQIADDCAPSLTIYTPMVSLPASVVGHATIQTTMANIASRNFG
ncbi:B4GT4-like protein [Mya arenaria]|uniref:B4GT4-like protein n=1 Tax=Mya arenaria TaxID=6604 RepID=A0ABY7FFN4_MYAAR|nr:B4GT4-like protein [Mya arenaria]